MSKTPSGEAAAEERPVDDVIPGVDADWQGVAAEDTDDVSAYAGARLAARSRRLLVSLMRPYPRWITAMIVLVIIDQITTMAGPLLVAYAIDSAVPALISGDSGPLTFALVGYLVAGAGSAGAKMLFIRVIASLTQAMLLDVRGRIFTHSQDLSVSFHEDYTSGRVISRMTSDLDTLQDLAADGLDGLINGILSVGVISTILLVLDVPLGLIALAAGIPIYFCTRWFQRISRYIYRRSRRIIAALIVQFTETMNGLRAVVSFRREKRNAKIFGAVNREYAHVNGDGYVALAKYSPGIQLIGNVTLTVVMLVGALRVMDGVIEVGVLAAFLLYVRRMYDPLEELAMFYNSFQSASAALEKISGLLEEMPSVPEPQNPVRLGPEVNGRLDLRGIDFSYRPDLPVVQSLDLTIPAGQTVAIVGATGAGKSTVAKLMARFYDPTSGVVELDGVDVSQLSTDDLRRSLVMVTQEPFLFSGSVAENIAIGNPEASARDIERAAQAVGASFIDELPQGYDTDVLARGGRLSAGQRQLIAFARAFLADPAVLILDEATASLDIPSEQAVQQALAQVLRGRTAVIIAHRLSTVMIADRVLVMADGRIVEDGIPADLVAAGGQFADVHEAWRASLV